MQLVLSCIAAWMRSGSTQGFNSLQGLWVWGPYYTKVPKKSVSHYIVHEHLKKPKNQKKAKKL